MRRQRGLSAERLALILRYCHRKRMGEQALRHYYERLVIQRKSAADLTAGEGTGSCGG
jgi:hypothetical protein